MSNSAISTTSGNDTNDDNMVDILTIQDEDSQDDVEEELDEEDIFTLSHSKWLELTRHRTKCSMTLRTMPTIMAKRRMIRFGIAFRQVKAEILGLPKPPREPPSLFLNLPKYKERLELETHPDYISKMNALLGPRLFDSPSSFANPQAAYEKILDRAKLYMERALHARWNSGDELDGIYAGESGDRIITYTQLCIYYFLEYVSFETSHKLMTPEHAKDTERHAALAYRDLETIALPITPEQSKILSDPHLRLTRGCLIGHPRIDGLRCDQCSFGSHQTPPKNYEPTLQDEAEARIAFLNKLNPIELRNQVYEFMQASQKEY